MWLLAMADDQLILAHRNSEWTGHAPILEEDIAIANIAQDELGHANLWYGVLADLSGTDADALVFQRPAAEWRNLQLAELPRGDWAFTMLRQYLLDTFEHVLLEGLLGSTHTGIAQVAARIRREELYHLRHSTAWITRLGLGTEESNRRMQAALDEQWPHTAQFFLTEQPELVEAGILPPTDGLRDRWFALVAPTLERCDLRIPALPASAPTRDQHTPHLAALLDEMQEVARLDPQADW